MAITPLDIRKTTFSTKMRGYDPQEVEQFLELMAEELTARLGDNARLEQDGRETRRRLDEATARQQELQETLIQAQRLSQNITDNARREAALLVKEAEITAETIIAQAIEQSQKIDAKILELRVTRRDLQLKLRNTLGLYQNLLDEQIEEERMGTLVAMPRRKTS